MKSGPRTIDIDILWMQNTSITSARLVVPHPRLHERAFALRPLRDIAPDAIEAPDGAIDDSACEVSLETLG